MAKKTPVNIPRTADKYAQRLAGTDTIGSTDGSNDTVQFSTSYSKSDRIAITIHEFNYVMPISGIDSLNDRVDIGLKAGPGAPDGTLYQQGILHAEQICLMETLGTNGNKVIQRKFKNDFTNLPGNGIYWHPAYLYYFYYVHGPFGNSLTMQWELIYTMSVMDDDTWQELFEQLVLGEL